MNTLATFQFCLIEFLFTYICCDLLECNRQNWPRNCLDFDVSSSNVSRGKKSFLFSPGGGRSLSRRKESKTSVWKVSHWTLENGKQMSFTLDLSVENSGLAARENARRGRDKRDGAFRRGSISCQELSLMDWEKHDESGLTAVDACKEISKERWQLILDKTRAS